MALYYTIKSFTLFTKPQDAIIEEKESFFATKNPIKNKGRNTPLMASIVVKSANPSKNPSLFNVNAEINIYKYGQTGGFFEVDKFVFPTTFNLYYMQGGDWIIGGSCHFEYLTPTKKKVKVNMPLSKGYFMNDVWRAIRWLVKFPDRSSDVEIPADVILGY